ncbi:MAG: sigma-54 dependent transcriptional regulator [bacterium]
MARILIVDDEPSIRTTLSVLLRKKGYEVEEAASAQEASRRMEEGHYDLVLTELNMRNEPQGMRLLDEVKDKKPGTEVIVLAAQGSMETAADAIRKGAYKYYTKPYDPDMLMLSIQHALERKQLQNQVRHLSSVLKGREEVGGLIYRSQQMEDILRLARRISQVDANVLIQGESGTGKELISRAIHSLSPRKDAPFHVIDCGAIPENLLESELFGHTKGAFTSADASRKGLFEVTQGGTLLLDEVGELPLSLQVKLLRAIQEGEIRPLGSNQTLRVDVRILAATNKDLQEEVQRGRFREDLYYRLDVISIRIPPLRERPEDILPLAQHFIQEYSAKLLWTPLRIDASAAHLLLRYSWPGNVRELENAMQRAVALATGDVLRAEDLPEQIRDSRPAEPLSLDQDLTLGEMEKRYILRVLAKHGGDRSRTARALGIGRNTLWRKLKEYGYKD